MKVVSTPKWQNVKCYGCSAGLEITLSDIRTEQDDEGDDIPFVKCPVCGAKVSLSGMNVTISRIAKSTGWDD